MIRWRWDFGAREETTVTTKDEINWKFPVRSFARDCLKTYIKKCDSFPSILAGVRGVRQFLPSLDRDRNYIILTSTTLRATQRRKIRIVQCVIRWVLPFLISSLRGDTSKRGGPPSI